MLFSKFTLPSFTGVLLMLGMLLPDGAQAQIVLANNQTATVLAQKMVGSGVTILNPTLSCPTNSNGIFTATNSTLNSLMLDSGVILSTGVVLNGAGFGISNPPSTQASTNTGGGSDADLSAAGGGVVTNDKCYLKFDFIPIGDTIKFQYLFGSEEYPEFSCSTVSDIFGFFIKPVSSGAYQNIALLPGSNIPISINTINPDPTACGNSAIGATYYQTNTGTDLVYDGYVADPASGTPALMTAISAVIPCDTYTLKLAIADVGDNIYDSGVFLKAGSLISTNVTVTSIGGTVNTGIDTPLVVRNCLVGQFQFNIPSPTADSFVIHYNIVGDAINGVDYGMIPDSAIILPGQTSASILITPFTTIPQGNDTEYVTLDILSPYVCSNGNPIVIGTATIMILNFLPIDAYATRDTVCPNGTTDLNVTIGQLSCGLAQTTCSGSVPADRFIGTESNTTFTPTPFNMTTNSYGDRLQLLYTRDELRAAGMEAGYINSTAFNVASKGSSDTFKNYTIKMACTADPQLGGSTFKSFTNIAQVLPPTSLVTTTGWNSFNFPTPYYWDGNSSLVMEICWNKTYGHNGGFADVVYYTNTTDNSTMFMPGGYSPAAAGVGPCNSNDESGANTVNNKRPNTRFNTCNSSNYNFSWTPATYLNDPTSQSPVASNITSAVTYTVTVTSALAPSCISTDQVTIGVDNSNAIVASPQSPFVVCAPGYVQLGAVAAGLPPLTNLPCGTTGTLNCSSPDSVTVGNSPTAATAPNNTPLFTSNTFSEYQFVITRNELLSSGLNSGTLRSLSFLAQTNSAPTYPVSNLRISLKCTPRTSFPSPAGDGDFEQGTTLVFTGASQVLIPNGWNKFVFNQPYNWDTTQNLIVQVCIGAQNNINVPGNTPVAMTFGTAIQKFSNSTDVCDNPGAPVLSYGQRPVVKFDYCSAPAAPFHYTWLGAFLSDSSIANPIAYVSAPGSYYVSTVGRNGCVVEDSVNILFPSHNYSITPVDTAICPGDRVPYLVSGAGIAGVQWYQNGFMPVTDISCTNCVDPVATPAQTLEYEVIVNDALNCPDTVYAHVLVYPLPAVDIRNSDTTIKYGDQFMLIVNGGTDFSWAPVGSLSDPRIPNPIASPVVPTQYTVIGLDEHGCKNTDTINVDIDYRDNLMVPSAFTPNGDGLNDVFRVAGITFHKIMEFRVFNRWGQEIFSTTNAKAGWDGTWKGVQQDMGVYKYIIRVAFPDGYTETYKGDVTLIR